MTPEAVLEVRVGLRFDDETIPVGTLARLGRNVHFEHKGPLARFDLNIHFEYEAEFIRRGLDISPLRCPLTPGVKSFGQRLFEGLPGVFADSMPDLWGRRLLDWMAEGKDRAPLSPLERLCHVGGDGMGALVYEPAGASPAPFERIDVDDLAVRAEEVQAGGANDAIEKLLRLNGSAGGARPKILIGLDAEGRDVVGGAGLLPPGYEPWLLKLNTKRGEDTDTAALEYVYALMARRAGIRMPPAHLIPSRDGPGHFAVKRFDRVDGGRLHMHTASGLLHKSIDDSFLSYMDLINLTMRLTRDIREVERMYRLAVFNVLAHNRDDHAKNFSFLMDRDGAWTLSPAYDLTPSHGFAGGHSTVMVGEGIRPACENLLLLGKYASIPLARTREILERTRSALADFKTLAAEHGVGRKKIEAIASLLEGADRTSGRNPSKYMAVAG